MLTLWHKDRYWPAELCQVTGVPLPGAIRPGVYCETVAAWKRVRERGFRPGINVIRKVGTSTTPGIAMAALMMTVATPEQLAWMRANETVEIPAQARPAWLTVSTPYLGSA